VVGGNNERVSGGRCLPFRAKTSGPAIDNSAPRNIKALEKSEGKTTMYTGNMIEELINSVERAEQHAREEKGTQLELRNFAIPRMEFQELVEVA
jgi:hypothetical protein